MADQSLSLLSGEEIKSAGLILNASDELFRASTYDLSIGDIIPGKAQAGTFSPNGEFRLAPGGTIRVVARESLKLPDNITGHVLLKNALCTRSVLAINIGVVDPGFEGPLSSTLINFGSVDFVLRPGLAFLRVSFHRCPTSPKAAGSDKWDRDKYVERVREQVLAFSAPTFLNLDETVSKAGDRAFGKFRDNLIIWVAVAAAVLAVITIFVPLGASYADRYLTDRRQWETETEKSIQQRVDSRYSEQLKGLSDEVSRLREEINSKKPSPSSSSRATNSRQ